MIYFSGFSGEFPGCLLHRICTYTHTNHMQSWLSFAQTIIWSNRMRQTLSTLFTEVAGLKSAHNCCGTFRVYPMCKTEACMCGLWPAGYYFFMVSFTLTCSDRFFFFNFRFNAGETGSVTRGYLWTVLIDIDTKT